MVSPADIERLLGRPLFPWQGAALETFLAQPRRRLLLHHRTGGGKTVTSLACLAVAGYLEAVVVAPPITTPQWQEVGALLGIKVTVVSHAKFRMKSFLLSRTVPVIADEFHLFGGHGKQGMEKLDKLAASLQAPLILASATPNYNDAERCYNIQHVMAPDTCRGGYIGWLYQHCITKANPFATEPLVTGFQRYGSAAEYLQSLPYTVYLPDNVSVDIVDIPIVENTPPEFITYGFNKRTRRIMASGMEARHQRKYFALIGDDGYIRDNVYDELEMLVGQATGPVLMFCNSSKVAEALHYSCAIRLVNSALVTGKTPLPVKTAVVDRFRNGGTEVLIGTATLATGTDGLDKICDTLIIVDDTQDDSLRKQLVGRILPRGESVDASMKRLYRLVY